MSSPSFRFARPGPFEVIVGAVLSLVLGALLAALILICKPVATVDAVPKDAKPGVIYCVQGRKDWSSGRRWLFKRDSFVQGHSVGVTEDELNAWVEAIYPPTPPPPAASKDQKAVETPWLQQGTPNLRLNGDKLAIVVVCDIDILGLTRKLVVQSEGSFAKGKKSVAFAPDTLMIGGFPVHRFPGAKTRAFKVLAGLYQFPEDVEKAWTALGEVKVENKQLMLNVGGS